MTDATAVAVPPSEATAPQTQSAGKNHNHINDERINIRVVQKYLASAGYTDFVVSVQATEVMELLPGAARCAAAGYHHAWRERP